jgi:L-iditol 2-dehydrogenase
MKAVVLYGINDLRYEDIPIPELKPGMIKIRVRAAGICGSDIPRVLEGTARKYPIVLGHEFAGDVVKCAPDVKSLKSGDRVSGVPHLPCYHCDNCLKGDYGLCKNYSFIGSWENGAFADYVVIPAQNAIQYNPSISYEEAALFEPATIALHGLRTADFKGGENTAVFGGGTVGLFTAQFARVMGAKSVTVFDIVPERLRLALDLGADAVIDSSKPDCRKTAMELTEGHGFPWIFEAAGAPATIFMAFDLAASKGRISFVGYPHVPVTFDPGLWEQIILKELILSGSRLSYTAPFPGLDWTLTAHHFTKGNIKYDNRMIDKKFIMKDATKAFALFRKPDQVKGRVLLVNDLPA